MFCVLQTENLRGRKMSLVNKSYIDIQICTQFNVGSIKDLDMQTLGDTNFAAANFLRGKSNNIDWEQEFDKNLGYYQNVAYKDQLTAVEVRLF